MTIKKKIQTKYRLPILNWTPLKPQQLKGTIFSDLDDEKLYTVSQLQDIVPLIKINFILSYNENILLPKNRIIFNPIYRLYQPGI